MGRTADWLGKVENNRIDLDRLSVVKALAEALDISLGEPTLLDWTIDSGTQTIAALMDYRVLAPFGGSTAAPLRGLPPAVWLRLAAGHQDQPPAFGHGPKLRDVEEA
ncbi:hypothetical protein [Micromonospora sp. DT229]|uniref:hypothetical protein n=1 Tax=Micromonospora sp. DT229 TaxID=3393430 RepID=UPI003CE713E0